MDWWSRLIGGNSAVPKPAPKTPAHDPQLRLARFKRLFHTVLQLCNRPRNIANERPILDQLHGCLDRIAVLIRDENRASLPHLCLQFAAANQIYNAFTRAASVSQHEPTIHSTISVLAALIDSEEEEFLSSASFAKSLMRLVTRVVNIGTAQISIEVETAIMELLFTIAAKIRLQPEILSVWFHSTAKPELEDVFVKEKKSFVGITQKEDFPLCYLLIDRVHHDGRIGDFARTGLLYIFEATGRSLELEEWVLSSDLPTLMASGLGALYSQLSRELSILHPDATLPAVLAMSDYSTTHPQATAESAFSERHQNDMTTFLSYLSFWQDVLDHCRSSDVKQTLLDHFQILFLQQLLYPSLLQSSDTDAGSSVAVLTYLTAMLESLEYPDLMNMILAYLLAIQDDSHVIPSAPTSPVVLPKAPPSPKALRRRQSLLWITAPKDPDDAVEPTLFSLVDLILNNISSRNSQSVFAALKLGSTLVARQKLFALGSLLKVQSLKNKAPSRTVGALNVELDKFKELATSLHDHLALDEAYAGLTDDVRSAIEAQVPFKGPSSKGLDEEDKLVTGRYKLLSNDHCFKALQAVLRTFFTNSVDVNLALTQLIVSIALCIDIRLDAWLTIDPSNYTFADEVPGLQHPWQAHLDSDENDSFLPLQKASRRPMWSPDMAPQLYQSLKSLAHELEAVRKAVANLDTLTSGRKAMLQAASLSTPLISRSEPPSLMSSPTQPSFLDVPKSSRGHGRSSSQSSLAPGRKKANDVFPPQQGSSLAALPVPRWIDDADAQHSNPSTAPTNSIYLPPPSETPSTTDVLMQVITFPAVNFETGGVMDKDEEGGERKASLNHVLTNVVVLQEFVLELVAVLQVRAAVLGEKEVKVVV